MNASVFGILLVGFVLMLIDVPSLLKKKRKKELWVYTLLMTLGMALLLLLANQVQIRSPLDYISQFFKPITTSIDKLIK